MDTRITRTDVSEDTTQHADGASRDTGGTVTIRIVAGSATGPTPLAAYDGALADAGVHNYNLVSLSSVIPAEATLKRVERVPDLGPAGGRLHVVEAAGTTPAPGTVRAGLAWTRGEEGVGLFYETAGEAETADLRERLEQGITAGRQLRSWGDGDLDTVVIQASADADEYGAAVALATFGRARAFE